MGFQSPQFDFIDNRFRHLRIKALEVICTQEVQATLDDPLGPFGLAGILDPSTGELLPGLQIVVTDVDPGVGVATNKICNVFVVTFQIVDSAGTVVLGPLTATVSDEVDCPGAGVGPGQTVVQKHDIQIGFCLIPVDTNEDGIFDSFFITLDIEYCLVVAKEGILKINAATPFCP
ncbi:MAG: hypothetical protein GX162_07050 [Firmicutes bacterium]|jgi:hypothetical protein|nr:hypothetical protein [Bacillota bacterium]